MVAQESERSFAMVSPAFPAPSIITFFPVIFSFFFLRNVESTNMPQSAVALSRPRDHHALRGLPVNEPGEYSPTSSLYSSIIHAMIFEFVFTSGAGISICGPKYLTMERTYHLERRSNSHSESSRGLTTTPHFPPPRGRSKTAHFMLIHMERAFTSSLVTSWWNRIPHLYGQRALLCCDRYPVNIRILPSSIRTGMFTSMMRSGWETVS